MSKARVFADVSNQVSTASGGGLDIGNAKINNDGFTIGNVRVDNVYGVNDIGSPTVNRDVRTYRLNPSTYNSGGTYYDTISHMFRVDPSATKAYLSGTIIKNGDFNYATQVARVDFELKQWEASTGNYEFLGREMFGQGGLDFSFKSDKSVWVYNGWLWTQEAHLVVYDHHGILFDQAGTNEWITTWSTPTHGVPAGGTWASENTWGA